MTRPTDKHMFATILPAGSTRANRVSPTGAALLALVVLGCGACKDSAKDLPSSASSGSASTFDAAALKADLASFPAQVSTVSWFAPGREIMVGWMRSVGFVSAQCEEVFASIERSYAADTFDGDQVRVFVGNIERAKVEACAKPAVEKGLFTMAIDGESLKIDGGGELGSVVARWRKVGEQSQVVAGNEAALEAFLTPGADSFADAAGVAALLDLFNPETGMWSVYRPDPQGNRFGVDHRGIVLSNGGTALRMAGRILFADASARDAGLSVCEKLYAESQKKYGTRVRGLLEKSDSGGASIRFNIQVSDAELLDELMRELLGDAGEGETGEGETGEGETGADGVLGAADDEQAAPAAAKL